MEMELIVAEQFAANALKTKTFSENSQELSELVQKVSVELQQGVAIRNTLQIVTGRKPTEPQAVGDLARNRSESVVVFVPGAFHVEAHFAPMCTRLAQSSVPAVTVVPPTTASARTSTYRDDVYVLRAYLEKLIEEQGKEVVVAAHSYGAVPACQTIGGLERSKRKAEGKPGGIVHVLFIAGLLVEQGRKMAEALEGGKAPSWAVFKVRDFIVPFFHECLLPCYLLCAEGIPFSFFDSFCFDFLFHAHEWIRRALRFNPCLLPGLQYQRVL